MKNKVFFISELFYPNKTSTAYIMTEIANYFAKKNHNVNVICSDSEYDKNFERNVDFSKFNNLKVYRTSNIRGSKNKIFYRVFSSLLLCCKFGKLILMNVKKDDTVFGVTNPFLIVFILSFLKIFKKFRYILLVHDVFPENAVPAGLISNNGIIYKITKKLFDWSYSKADELIVIGRDMYELVGKKTQKQTNIHIVQNWFDDDLKFDLQVDRNSYLKLNLSGKIVIGFAGNIGRVQYLHRFIDVFLKVNNPNLHLVILGDGAEKNSVLNLILSNPLNNITYLESKPRSEQSYFLSCFDIGLITLAPSMKGLGVPSKAYNLLALGKPVLYLGDKNSELDLLLKEENLGWSFDWENEELIIQFLKNLNKVDDLGINVSIIQEFAKDNYSSSVILEKLDKII